MGKPIWSAPRSDEYLNSFLVDSLWEKFVVVSLEENHRQEEDRLFADMLNRIRVGSFTNDDIDILQTRVREEDHPDLKGALVIASTHDVVNKQNEVRQD